MLPETYPAVTVQATPAPSCIITWSAVTSASGYTVYRSDTADGTYTFRQTLTGLASIFWTDTAVTGGSTYYYRVRAVNRNGEGPLSPAVSGTPPAAGTSALLAANTWTEGNISATGQVYWYTITAASAASYSIQWDDSGQGSSTYSCNIGVSAYRSNGTGIFSGVNSGYTSPPSVSMDSGETIYVQVEGYTAASTGSYAIRYYAPAALPPQAYPQNFRVGVTPAPECVITWNALTGATGYTVYRSDTADGTYTLKQTLTGSASTTWTDTGVTAGSTYYYKVAAVNDNGEGPWSPAASGTPPPSVFLDHNTWTEGNISAAGQVYWYTITAAAAASYSIQWDDRLQGTSTYSGDIKVSAYRGNGTTSIFTSVDSGYLSPRSVSMTAGETIYLRVEGYFSTDTGTYAIQYYNPAAVPPQIYLQNVAVRVTPAPECVITWSALTGGAAGYTVYRSDTADGTYTLRAALTGLPTTTWTDTAVTAGSTYYYKVAAVNDNGDGPWSPAVSGTPPPSVLLVYNTWTTGNINAVGQEVYWYTITAAAAASYFIQWDDNYASSGTYSGDIKVSAYLSNGTTSIFSDVNSGYNSPRSVSLTAGETIYLRVEGLNSTSFSNGTYAIRYYQ
jgi:fibronectin type 3 domain-containing protein